MGHGGSTGILPLCVPVACVQGRRASGDGQLDAGAMSSGQLVINGGRIMGRAMVGKLCLHGSVRLLGSFRLRGVCKWLCLMMLQVLHRVRSRPGDDSCEFVVMMP